MTFPWTDPQFWLVTAAAVGAVRILVGQVVPRSTDDGCPSCNGCAAGSAARVRPPGGGGSDRLVVLGSGRREP